MYVAKLYICETDTSVRIPISAIFDGRAEQILNKYGHRLPEFFGIRKDRFNSRLKTAVRHAGITKMYRHMSPVTLVLHGL